LKGLSTGLVAGMTYLIQRSPWIQSEKCVVRLTPTEGCSEQRASSRDICINSKGIYIHQIGLDNTKFMI